MPILITFSAPIQTTALLPVASAYAIIEKVAYSQRGLFTNLLQFEVRYYANAGASISTTAASLEIDGLPTSFSQESTPQQVNALVLFDFMEAMLKTRLDTDLPAGTLVEKVA